MGRVKPLHLFWKRLTLMDLFIGNIHSSLCSINLCLENGPTKCVFENVFVKYTKYGGLNTDTNAWFEISSNTNTNTPYLYLQIQYVFNHSPHDDVIKWKHFPRYWPFVRGIHRSPVNSPHKDQWRGALMFSLICARISGWVNNREAGDLRRHRAHYDVIEMWQWNWNIPA